MSVNVATYGPDRTGLICGFAFGSGEGGRQVDSESALDCLREPASGGFAWLHYDLASAATERWMAEHLNLPQAFFDALHEETRSTRIEHAQGWLVAIVNDVLFEFAFGASHVSTLWMCVGPRLIVSARRKPLRSIDRLRASVKRGDTFAAPVHILTHLLHDEVDVLTEILRDATTRVDGIEDALLAGRLETQRIKLGSARRVLVRLRRVLAPEPAALFRLLSVPPAWMGEPQVQELRAAAEEFSIGLNDMSSLLERIKLLQEEIAAQINEQNNRSLFLLTVFTVLALPINIIAGLFGMNVGGIPFNQDERGFWMVVFLVLTFTLPAVYILLRRRRD